jgi:glutathione-regulated potassium-efflux system ancillary protein KefC/glutathione-regulated potassium-efflux system protein KefB
MRTTIFGLGLAQLLGTAALVAAASLAFGLDWRVGAAVGLILAMSSTAIVLQSLEEKGQRQGPVGEASFGVLLFQDLAVIPLFALLPLLAPAGVAPPPSHAANLLAALPGWLQALAQLAAVVAVVVGGRYATRPMFRFIAAPPARDLHRLGPAAGGARWPP